MTTPLPPQSTSHLSSLPWVGLLALVALPRFIRIWTAASISEDAVSILGVVQRFIDGDLGGAFSLSIPPLYPLAVAIPGAMFGHIEGVAGVVSILCGLFALPPLMWMCRKFLTVEQTILAGVVYAMHPVLIDIQSQITSSALFLTVVMWTAYLVLRFCERPSSRQGLYIGALLFLGLATRSEGAVLALGVLIAVGVQLRIPEYRRGGAILLGQVAVFFLLGFLLLRIVIGPAHFHDLFSLVTGRLMIFLHLIGFPIDLPSGSQIPGISWRSGWRAIQKIGRAATIPYLLLAGAGWWMAWKARRDQPLPMVVGVFGVLLIGLTFIGALFMGYASRRYFLGGVLVLLPLAVMVLHDILVKAGERFGRRAPVMIMILGALLAVVPLVKPRHSGSRGYREAGEWILQMDGPGRVILSQRPVTAYYALGTGVNLKRPPMRSPVGVVHYLAYRSPAFGEPSGWPEWFSTAQVKEVGVFNGEVHLMQVLPSTPEDERQVK